METERHNFLCDLENSLYPTKDWGVHLYGPSSLALTTLICACHLNKNKKNVEFLPYITPHFPSCGSS